MVSERRAIYRVARAGFLTRVDHIPDGGDNHVRVRQVDLLISADRYPSSSGSARAAAQPGRG